jgi:hypothetical protein
VVQHGVFGGHEVRTRFLHQQLPGPLERRQRISLTTGPVQGPNQQHPAPFPKRRRGHQRLQLAHRCAGITSIQRDRGQLLLTVLVQLLQPPRRPANHPAQGTGDPATTSSPRPARPAIRRVPSARSRSARVT